jgi:hypothetical protein
MAQRYVKEYHLSSDDLGTLVTDLGDLIVTLDKSVYLPKDYSGKVHIKVEISVDD